MSKKRIQTFDLLRSIAIILMVLAHVYDQWLVPDSEWVAAISYLVLSPMGVPGFVFVAGLGFSYSWTSKKQRGISQSQNRIFSLSRTIIILAISFGYNLAGVLIHGQVWENLWFWYILQTMAICRLLGIFLVELSVRLKIIISGILIAGTTILLYLLNNQWESSGFLKFVYWFLFNPINADSIMFFLPVFMIGMILGEKIFLVFQKSVSDQLKYAKRLLFIGVSIIIISILIGFPINTFNYGWDRLIDQLNTHPDISITGFPLFLSRNSFAWILISIGVETALMAFFLWKIDINIDGIDSKKEIGKIRKIFKKIFIESPQLLGKYSLTIYLTHYVAYLIPFTFNYKEIGFAFLGFLLCVWFGCWLIERFSKGKFSIEFLIGYGANEIGKSLQKMPKSQENGKEEMEIE